MKKLISAYMLLALVTLHMPVSAAEVSTQAVQAAVKKSLTNNAGAIKNNKRVDFVIDESFYDERLDQNNGPFRVDLACKAYALDTHWLLLAGTCMRYYTEGDIRAVGDHEYMERHGRTIKSASPSMDGYAENGSVMLLWSAKAQYAAPFVNVLATASPNNLFALTANHTVKINTARFGTDAVKKRKLLTNSVKNNTFKLDEGATDLSGTATDPLFMISANGNEFLAAYNNGTISYAYNMTFDDAFHTFDGQPSDIWYSLTKEDLNFIKSTVTQHRPSDWARIKNRLFFNQTVTPYFTK